MAQVQGVYTQAVHLENVFPLWNHNIVDRFLRGFLLISASQRSSLDSKNYRCKERFLLPESLQLQKMSIKVKKYIQDTSMIPLLSEKQKKKRNKKKRFKMQLQIRKRYTLDFQVIYTMNSLKFQNT